MSKKVIECAVCGEDVNKSLSVKIPSVGRICPTHKEVINKYNNEKKTKEIIMKTDNDTKVNELDVTNTEVAITIGDLPEFQQLQLQQTSPTEIAIIDTSDELKAEDIPDFDDEHDNVDAKEEQPAETADGHLNNDADLSDKPNPKKEAPAMKKKDKKKKQAKSNVVATISIVPKVKEEPKKKSRMETFKKAGKTGLKIAAGVAVVGGLAIGGVKLFGRD